MTENNTDDVSVPIDDSPGPLRVSREHTTERETEESERERGRRTFEDDTERAFPDLLAHAVVHAHDVVRRGRRRVVVRHPCVACCVCGGVGGCVSWRPRARSRITRRRTVESSNNETRSEMEEEKAGAGRRTRGREGNGGEGTLESLAGRAQKSTRKLRPVGGTPGRVLQSAGRHLPVTVARLRLAPTVPARAGKRCDAWRGVLEIYELMKARDDSRTEEQRSRPRRRRTRPGRRRSCRQGLDGDP